MPRLLQRSTTLSFQRIYTYNVESYAYVMSAALGRRVQSVITHRAGAEDAKDLGIVRLPVVVVTATDEVAVHELDRDASCHDFCFHVQDSS